MLTSITRRSFLGASAAPLLVPQASLRPNVLWICTDQQRFDTIGVLGNNRIRTPNLDRLATSGTAFTNAYCQSPICTPSRASFMTGCYPSTIHVNRNGNAYFPKEATERLVSRIFAESGYDCGLVGKLHLNSCKERPEPRVNDGYRVFRWSHSPKPNKAWPPGDEAYQGWLHSQGVSWVQEFGKQRLDGWPEPYQPGVAAKYDQATWCANEAIAFLSEKRSSPWFMNVNMFAPHPLSGPRKSEDGPVSEGVKASHSGAFHAPPEYLRRMDPSAMQLPLFDERDSETHRSLTGVAHQTSVPLKPSEYPARHMVAAYYAFVELVDAQVGRMLEALESTGQLENTIIVFTTDHGEMLGDHGLFAKGCRFYEGAVHVPLLVSWPARFRSAQRSSALVELIDIAPTLLEAAGLRSPDGVQGKSLTPLLVGQQDLSTHRAFVRSEYHDAVSIDSQLETHANMYFDGRWKLVVYHGFGGELYDLKEDPNEFRNLWSDPKARDVRTKLTAQLFDAVMLATDPGQPRLSGF